MLPKEKRNWVTETGAQIEEKKAEKSAFLRKPDADH